MAGPPDKIEEGDLWAALEMTPRPFRVVDFPRNDPFTGKPVGEVAVWVLVQGELMICQARADKFTRDLMREKKNEAKAGEENTAYQDIYRNAVSVELIAKAFRRVKDLANPAFPSPASCRDKFTTDEISILVRHYLRIQIELGPILASMSKEEMDAWLERLSREGRRDPLDLLSSAQLEDLVMHSASRLYPSATDTSSSGSPLESPTPTPEGEGSAMKDEFEDAPTEMPVDEGDPVVAPTALTPFQQKS